MDCNYITIEILGEQLKLQCAECQHTRIGKVGVRYRRACGVRPRFSTQRPPDEGPGRELLELFKELGIQEKPGCGCKAKARQMNAWGIEGCRENLDEIVGWFKANAHKFGWGDWIKAAALATVKRLWFDPRDPFPGVVREAIRRAEEKPRPVEMRLYEQLKIEGQSLLLRFSHGFGDHVQLTVVLQHLKEFRPGLVVDVECNPDMFGLYQGLCRRAYPHGLAPHKGYDVVHFVAWWEPTDIYSDSPSTKAEKYLREAFGITPRPELCSYRVNVEPAGKPEKPFALLHFAGVTALPHKMVSKAVQESAIAAVKRTGLEPIIVEGQRPAHELVALAKRATLCVGIDSGPGHAFAASGVPTILLWTRHHPLNFCGTNPNVLHFVPHDHPRYARGEFEAGRAFFEKHYRHRVYEYLAADVVEEIERATH